MTIATNKKGDVFEQFLAISESEVGQLRLEHPLTHALVVAKYEDRFLLMFNTWRQEWEVPGGIRDEGESCKECAIRELYEETNQVPGAIRFNGLMKFRLHHGRTEYGVLYSVRLQQLQPFTVNDEALEIVLWDGVSELDNCNEIDKKLLDYYQEPQEGD